MVEPAAQQLEIGDLDLDWCNSDETSTSRDPGPKEAAARKFSFRDFPAFTMSEESDSGGSFHHRSACQPRQEECPALEYMLLARTGFVMVSYVNTCEYACWSSNANA